MSDTERRIYDMLNEHFPFVVEGVAILIVGIIGVVINTVALGILFRKRVNNWIFQDTFLLELSYFRYIFVAKSKRLSVFCFDWKLLRRSNASCNLTFFDHVKICVIKWKNKVKYFHLQQNLCNIILRTMDTFSC